MGHIVLWSEKWCGHKVIILPGQPPFCLATDIRTTACFTKFSFYPNLHNKTINTEERKKRLSFISIYNKTFFCSFGFNKGLVLTSFLFIGILSFLLLVILWLLFFGNMFLLLLISHRKILMQIRFWYQIYCSILE